ncbi:SDR family oxidoreductase [Guptibacillus algicola]|uniref:SDR family oxidoreductase n=1 Tax=Guptibacillus algicola TaxID=225844 RepID=UPI001CD4F0A1|nr:SDR family oxidoreductase [Alkalihalobacillus algicola]MCA0986771.1 SDR family oxidoreductase [Alkalihalobacillus algicola]
MSKKTALVTGSNRGIGFEIARQLGKQGVTVIMTARDKEKGIKAMEELKEEDLDVHFYELDITSDSSVKHLYSEIYKNFHKLDILVNNAGVFIDQDFTVLEVDRDTVSKTMETNTYGPLFLTQALISLLKNSEDGRVINVSSGLGSGNSIGESHPAYSLSKAALNIVTIQLADALRDKGIKVNAMCPGWVKTDMGGAGAMRSVQDGADTAVWLSLAELSTTGKFFRDRKMIDW